VDGISDLFVTLDVDNGTKLKILKKQIAGSMASLQSTKTESKK
jgi:hypothetical protein